jgi:hypothetical protein
LAFAQRAQQVYQQQQLGVHATSGKENAVKTLESALPAFVKAIKDKASPMYIMMIAHIQIHPNLMDAYNLKAIG